MDCEYLIWNKSHPSGVPAIIQYELERGAQNKWPSPCTAFYAVNTENKSSPQENIDTEEPSNAYGTLDCTTDDHQGSVFIVEIEKDQEK